MTPEIHPEIQGQMPIRDDLRLSCGWSRSLSRIIHLKVRSEGTSPREFEPISDT